MNVQQWLSTVVITVLLCSCGNKQVKPPADTGSPSDGGIVLSAAAVEQAGITFGLIEDKKLSHDVSARGMIVLLPEDVAIVSALMGGTVQSIGAKYGQQVRKGEVLATYTHPDIIEVQQRYLNARTMLEVKENSYKRLETLWKDKVNSEKEYQQARMEYQHAQAEFNSIKAKLNLLNISIESLDKGEVTRSIPIISPISGQVEEIYVSMGQYVDMQDPVFRVIDKSQPVLQLKVFEKDIHLIESGQRVTFASPSSSVEDFEARIFNVGAIVEKDARVIDVMASITGQTEGLIPGMFVASTIHTREQFLKALPESAVVVENENEKYGFYTTDAQGSESYRFYPFDLTAGFEEEGYIEVYPITELPPNARVVLTGVYYLKSELMKSLGD